MGNHHRRPLFAKRRKGSGRRNLKAQKETLTASDFSDFQALRRDCRERFITGPESNLQNRAEFFTDSLAEEIDSSARVGEQLRLSFTRGRPTDCRFSRPFGTWHNQTSIPALKRRAILIHPSGMNKSSGMNAVEA